ncbi:hypothetical protein [Rubripirellula reticaptiva]|uniref:Cytochrome c domain-containing protein n=1 Tax=Rubripirellula reticaptiva TaxID=2528013 RepID=A0A5C6EPC2_9BACT|nr:hypothetical protein [Rubripirellula reticaptiva]TWU49466.1 hypothetical protein Poly59_40810 [Rubripirellula reticaptiva]
MRTILIGPLCVVALSITSVARGEAPKLDMNDVSWLWPAPQNAADLDRVLSISSIQAKDGSDVWSDDQFQDLIATIESDASKLGESQIGLRDSFRNKQMWKIAAMRIDPTAPGGHVSIVDAFGSSPQIRLVLQPVDVSGEAVVVHDVAVHLVFDYTVADATSSRKVPDREAFTSILRELDGLKAMSEIAGATTTGKSLGVHPGLKAEVDGLSQAVKDFLESHLASENLSAMAIMGLDRTLPEPWMFLALGKSRQPPGCFGPVPFLPVQVIDFRSMSVSPPPIVNNRSLIDSRFVVPVNERRGVATAALFNRGVVLDDFAIVGTDGDDEVFDGELRYRDIADVVANPVMSHFFNTDCVSCHTETRRRIALDLEPGTFAFRVGSQVPEIADEVLPKHDWNVRNFGWFPPHRVIGGGPTVATATQRTANETAEVVSFIAEEYGER